MDRWLKASYFLALAAEAILRFPYARQRRRTTTSRRQESESGSERVVLGVLGLATGVLPVIYSISHLLEFANYRLSRGPKVLAGALGVALLSSGVCVFWRAHHDLGANWSPTLEINTQQTLVTSGIYGSIRHPMYASQALWCLGQALVLHNWLAGFGGIVTFLALYLIRVPREEQMMLDHFGEQYAAYAQRTGRILPRRG